MKITIKYPSSELVEERDYRSFLYIEVEGALSLKFRDGDSEDANLSRDFKDCWKIEDLIKLVFEAGRNTNQELRMESIEVDNMNQLKA